MGIRWLTEGMLAEWRIDMGSWLQGTAVARPRSLAARVVLVPKGVSTEIGVSK